MMKGNLDRYIIFCIYDIYGIILIMFVTLEYNIISTYYETLDTISHSMNFYIKEVTIYETTCNIIKRKIKFKFEFMSSVKKQCLIVSCSYIGFDTKFTQY